MTAPSHGQKVYTLGTHRERHPDHTWELIAPMLSRFGITRLADVTGLDTIGIPVWMSIRPLAMSLSVAQGKGITHLLAKISAAMEAIEFWHAENVQPSIRFRRVAGREIQLPYQVENLSDVHGLIGPSTPLDWVDALGLRSGAVVPLPVDLVTYPRPDRNWTPGGIAWSSNGLASGNSRDEACPSDP